MKTNFEAGVQRQDLPTFKEHDGLGAGQLNLIVGAIEDNNQFLSEHYSYGRPRSLGAIKAVNSSAVADVGAWQLVELSGIEQFDPITPTFRTPSADGLELLGITTNWIGREAAGWVNVYGVFVVQCPAGAVTGNHLGSASGSTVPQVDSDGPLIVMGTFVEDAVNYAVVIWASGSGGGGETPIVMWVGGNTAAYCDRTGALTGLTTTAYMLPGHGVPLNSYGHLAVDSAGLNMFVPSHGRILSGVEFRVEVRGADPVLPATGRMWLRS